MRASPLENSRKHRGPPLLAPKRPGTGQTGGVLDVSEDEFEALVGRAVADLPAELAARMNNVALFIEDEAPAEDPGLLGLYEGIPLTERDSWYSGVLPDSITIFRLPIMRMCRTPDEVVHEVHITVVHEIAHHFGIDDERLHQLGYG